MAAKPLTAELVLLRSKSDSLFSVKNLNLWGNEIDDVKLLRQMPNVEVLSLSLNKISSLKEFANCQKLQELYLRRNNIMDISEVRYLSPLQNLKILWLLDNPCSEIENYREIVIKLLPNLIKLDNTQITSEERRSATSKTFAFLEENTENPGISLENKPFQPIQNENPRSSILKKESPKEIEPVLHKEMGNRNSYFEGGVRQITHSHSQQLSNKNENILCAVLALLKELDETSLELVRREIERKMSKIH